MERSSQQLRFELLIVPHMPAAYNLARWLTGDPDDAADVVQESYVRALRFFDSFRGGDARAWLLKIVRNMSFNCLIQARNRTKFIVTPMGDNQALLGENIEFYIADESADPELVLMQQQALSTMDELIGALPIAYREALILRELEDLSYREIAEVLELPIGTVMSRLARARTAIQKRWHANASSGGS